MKKNSFGKLVLFVFLGVCPVLLPAGQARAEDIYYAQAAVGSGSGGGCANARAVSDLSWGPDAGSIGAGDTAHLCGTIATAIAVGASGSDADHPVTIKFEGNARMSKDTWGDGGAAITVSGRNWVVIDGGTNGIIESTDVGSAKTYRHNNKGVSISGTSTDIEVRNLTIPQLYSRTKSNSQDFAGNGIKLDQGTLNNIRIHHNAISKAEVLIYVVYGTYSNIRIYNNTLTHGAAGIIVGDPTSNSTIDTLELYNNTINLYDDAADLNCTNTYHNDGIHFWAAASGSSYRNVRIHGNTIGPDMGACTATTGWIFLEDTRSNILIYNNLLLANDSNQCPTDAMVYDKGDGNAANNGAQIYNNTFAFAGGSKRNCSGVEVQEGGEIVKNNIFMNLNYAVFGGPIASPFTNDYNLYYNNNNNLEGKSRESHGVYGDPLLGPDFRPLYAIGAGVNSGTDLSATFTTDKDGNTRTGSWDIGAYEYIDTTPPTVISTTPANGATGISTGVPITVTFSEAMDASTIVPAAFILTGGGSTFPCTASYSGGQATFLPASSLAPSTTYTGTVKTVVKDLVGNQMALDYTWTFTTGGDTTPPSPGGGGDGGGGGGCSVARGEKSNGPSPMGTVLALMIPAVLLFLRRASRRINRMKCLK